MTFPPLAVGVKNDLPGVSPPQHPLLHLAPHSRQSSGLLSSSRLLHQLPFGRPLWLHPGNLLVLLPSGRLPWLHRFGQRFLLPAGRPPWLHPLGNLSILLPSGRPPWLHLFGQHQRRLQSPSVFFHHLRGLWNRLPLGIHDRALQHPQQVGAPISFSVHPWRQVGLVTYSSTNRLGAIWDPQ